MKKVLLRFSARVILLAFTAAVVLPLAWLIYSSLKVNEEFLNPWALPKQLHFENYTNAFVKAKMGTYYLNSIVVTLVSVLGSLFIGLTTAYAIMRFSNPFTRFVKNYYLSAFFLPAIVGLIPLFILLNSLQLLDNRFGLILIYITIEIPFSVFVLSGFMANLPKDYEEAAFIDGTSRYGALFKVVVPLTVPALVTVSIFVFLGLWNEFVYAYTFLMSESKMTLPVGLNNLAAVAKYETDWGQLFAGLVIVLIPTLVFYILLQKRITSGVSAGSIKM
ncbi:carbohydrate ABC transporter permease [Paenibacillus nasutitermitis]|uniref:Sugar ABC transporter permease n=1 Tax=Paenibacillus nasutitermitis TaxID=1652958 RepID=A0A916YSY6_9BACL|nr:carbohydrate ABC transporter permease [Paenibacillus nasutitermitis]GGD60151.1 sugar ABC transporter permease [Paenibacillus nasutitermitis]